MREGLSLASEKTIGEENRCLQGEMMEPAKKSDYYSLELLGYLALAVGVSFGILLSYYPYSHNPDPISSVLVPMFSGIALLGFVVSFAYIPFLRRRDRARDGKVAMKCSNCGAENPEGKIFCDDCGWRLFETSPRNVEHIIRVKLKRAIISIALGLVFGWLGFMVVLVVFEGGAPVGINLIDPMNHGNYELLAGWLLASAGCALLFYMTFTQGKEKV